MTLFPTHRKISFSNVIQIAGHGDLDHQPLDHCQDTALFSDVG